MHIFQQALSADKSGKIMRNRPNISVTGCLAESDTQRRILGKALENQQN